MVRRIRKLRVILKIEEAKGLERGGKTQRESKKALLISFLNSCSSSHHSLEYLYNYFNFNYIYLFFIEG